jgi:uncharacterized phage protein (TIGR02220 family)
LPACSAGFLLMAGDWIKMRSDLLDDPAVFRLSTMLQLDRFSVVGRLHAFWAWVDKHASNGYVTGASLQLVDEVVTLKGFGDALVVVQWLEVDGDRGLHIPRFERHNGQSAKERALTNQRVKKHRERNADVTVMKRSTVTREEKRREDIKTTPIVPRSGDGARFKSEHRKQAIEYLGFLNAKAGKHFRPVPATLRNVEARLAEGVTLQDLKTLTARKCREWLGTDMEKFLRPETLCNATKCHSYLGEITPEDTSGGESCNAQVATGTSRPEPEPASVDGVPPTEREAGAMFH